MDNELALVGLTALTTQLGTDEQFEEHSRSTSFLGRLQLFTKGRAIDEGLVPPGTYGIPESDKKIIKLGNSIDVLPLARRLKALDMSDKEAIISNYDATSTEFNDIAARSKDQNSGCQYGTSFLVIERGTRRFLEFFCGTKSTRPVAGEIAYYLPLSQAQIDAKAAKGDDVSKLFVHGSLPVTLKVRLAKNSSFSWHVPEPQECSMPFANLPSLDVINAEIAKFVTAKTDDVESVKEQPGKKARAR